MKDTDYEFDSVIDKNKKRRRSNERVGKGMKKGKEEKRWMRSGEGEERERMLLNYYFVIFMEMKEGKILKYLNCSWLKDCFVHVRTKRNKNESPFYFYLNVRIRFWEKFCSPRKSCSFVANLVVFHLLGVFEAKRK